jgi:hypothetical protein
MICSVSKWFISNALDARKEIPSFIQRHLSQCPSCQDFVRLSQVLANKSAQDAISVILETPDSLLEKMKPKSLIHQEPEHRHGRSRRLVPIVSTALAAFLIFAFVLFRPFQIFSPDSDEGPLQIPRISALSRKSLQKLAVQIEAPYDKEWLSLKDTIASTVNQLTTYLDLKIDQN